MRKLLASLIISFAVFAIASPSFAGNKHGDNFRDRDKKEQHHGMPSGKPFKKLMMKLEALENRIEYLEEENAELKSNLACISGESDAYNLFFEGCNVHVRNGVGSTDTINTRGNLIIGYNEEPGEDPLEPGDRDGSHNLVIGRQHKFLSYGGLVAGEINKISSPGASVSGGAFSEASGQWASVCGGDGNLASASRATVCGGKEGVASGFNSSVAGGQTNTASGAFASVSGGRCNLASGWAATVSGGGDLKEDIREPCSGRGTGNIASGDVASVSGGVFNEANGHFTSVSGGQSNTASGDVSSVSGGRENLASGDNSTVSGGANSTASLPDSHVP